MRDTPPSNQDGPMGWEPTEVSHFVNTQVPPNVLSPARAADLARAAYESSTNWLNASRRAQWNNNSRAFQSLHPTGSKYTSSGYTHRSTLYRPKTRAMVRRDEAATASAFFSNEDVVDIAPADADDPVQLASAAIMKELLQYRLTKSIPWFLTVCGARQDCDVYGVCALEIYWKYEERENGTERRIRLNDDNTIATNKDGSVATEEVTAYEKLHDKPCVDLIPPENIRIDPGCDWRDPVGTSPYIIKLMPVYLQDARDKIADGEWNPVAESMLIGDTDMDDDVTRRSREFGRVPGKDDDAWKPRDYHIVWVHVNIIRFGGQDWHFLTVGRNGALLTDPRPLKEVHLHGERPFVMGYVVLETHKAYPDGKVELIRDLQRATNDDLNLRFDNLKLNLNPRQFVRAGVAADLKDLSTFIPGKTVIVNSKAGAPMQNDIAWDRPPAPGPEAFAEQDRLNLDFDEMTGSFSNSSVQASQLTQQSATGMHLMSGEASGMTEYELRLFAETTIEPTLRLLIKLEQAYETDPIILALAGKRAQIYQKYGIDGITDELLNQEVTTRVNVGIGATNPQLKLRNFLMGAEAIGKMFGPIAVQGANFEEVTKEIWGLLGYKDGARFIKTGFDPQVAMLQQQLQKLQQGQKGDTHAPPDYSKVQTAQITAQGKIKEQQLQNENDARSDAMETQRVVFQENAETHRQMLELQMRMAEQRQQRQQEQEMERFRAHTDMQRQAQQQAMRPQQPQGQPRQHV